MELSFQTLPMRYLGNPIQGSQTQEQTAEVIVPDSCPDVARIVYTSASVIVRGKECRTGSVLVSGGIRASALCIPEDDSGARTLESYLPFSLRIEHPGVTERTQAVVSAFVRQIDARLIHSRKILIRADLCCTAECLTAEEETLYALSAPPKELQTKRRTYPVSLPKETAEKNFTVTDDLTLPTGKPFASEICCYETVPRITDCKVVGSKAVFKGTLEVNMLYLSGDGSAQTWEQQLPFSQYAELAEDYDEASLCVTPLVSAAELTLEPSGEGRAMSLAVTLNAQCLVSGPVTMELIEDAYAVGAALEPAWTQYALACRLDCQTLRDEVRQQLAADAEAVLECAVYHDLPYFERAEGKLRVRAPLNMKLLYRDKDGALQGAAARAEAACETALCEMRAAPHLCAWMTAMPSPASTRRSFMQRSPSRSCAAPSSSSARSAAARSRRKRRWSRSARRSFCAPAAATRIYGMSPSATERPSPPCGRQTALKAENRNATACC